VTCSQDETVRIWDLESGEQEGMAMEHGGRTYWHRGLAVTRDGQRILSGSSDKVLRVWDVETQQSIAEWVGHDGSILCIAMSPDDQLVASGDREGRIVIREMKEGQIKAFHRDCSGRCELASAFLQTGRSSPLDMMTT
jgi:WD40 repeat protein